MGAFMAGGRARGIGRAIRGMGRAGGMRRAMLRMSSARGGVSRAMIPMRRSRGRMNGAWSLLGHPVVHRRAVKRFRRTMGRRTMLHCGAMFAIAMGGRTGRRRAVLRRTMLRCTMRGRAVFRRAMAFRGMGRLRAVGQRGTVGDGRT